MATAAHRTKRPAERRRPGDHDPPSRDRSGRFPTDRVWKRQVPAWMMSGGIHLTLMALFLIYAYFVPTSMPASPLENQLFETKVDDLAAKQNFENSDVGLNPDQQTNYNLDRLENVSVPGPVTPEEPVGIVGHYRGPAEAIPHAVRSAAGKAAASTATNRRSPDVGKEGGWMGGRNLPGVAFAGRRGATRQKMLAEGGGNAASEAAVTKGLQWLVRQQKNDGRWALTDATAADDVAATGLGLLPFLAAGQTHKPAKGEKEGPYARTVEFGLSYLKSKQRINGSFNGARDMHGP